MKEFLSSLLLLLGLLTTSLGQSQMVLPPGGDSLIEPIPITPVLQPAQQFSPGGGEAQYVPDDALLDYTRFVDYETALAHSHSPTVAVDAIYGDRFFIGPSPGTNPADAFLGNAIEVWTLDGRHLRLWCAFSANMAYYIELLLAMPSHRSITITYDPDCGLATWVALR